MSVYYYELPKFAELVSNGDINLSSAIPLKSMDHNMIHNVSFIDHCNHLCKKHDTNLLRLLSVIIQKLNGDMILRTNRYPQLNDKLQGAIDEWQESIEPIDLFRCPDSCYDSNNVVSLQNMVQGYEDEFSKLKSSQDDSQLYETLEQLKNNYHDCDERVRDNLLQIEERCNEYDIPHRKLFDDLSTRPKSFYMEKLLEGDNNLNNNVNMRLVKGIPENIHVIFLNSALLSTLISKCMEGHKSECMRLKQLIDDKNNEIDGLMDRVGPGVPLSENLLNMFEGIKSFFEDKDDTLPSDDEELDESNIADVLNKVVEKNNDDLVVKDDSDNVSEMSEKEMYHLKIKGDSDDEGGDEDDEDTNIDDKEEQNGGDNISFF
tara:strand:- start:863 stop:1987 length:1125 start_codon:yes stop_codon:yes gene_type:complete